MFSLEFWSKYDITELFLQMNGKKSLELEEKKIKIVCQLSL